MSQLSSLNESFKKIQMFQISLRDHLNEPNNNHNNVKEDQTKRNSI